MQVLNSYCYKTTCIKDVFNAIKFLYLHFVNLVRKTYLKTVHKNYLKSGKLLAIYCGWMF